MCHCLRVVKAHRMMYIYTYLGHHVTLSYLDLGQILTFNFEGQIIRHSTRHDETNTTGSKSYFIFLNKEVVFEKPFWSNLNF